MRQLTINSVSWEISDDKSGDQMKPVECGNVFHLFFCDRNDYESDKMIKTGNTIVKIKGYIT